LDGAEKEDVWWSQAKKPRRLRNSLRSDAAFICKRFNLSPLITNSLYSGDRIAVDHYLCCMLKQALIIVSAR
jgi:hypothetical protein